MAFSEYEVLRLRRIRRNEAKLASLGFLGGMSSASSPFSDRPNRKKRVAPQDDVERRVHPKRNAKNTTSYRDLDNHVIYKRTRPINSSDTGKEDTIRKRMREDEAEYSPSGGYDKEEYDEDEDELESGEFDSHILQMFFFPTSGPHHPAAANAVRFHLGDCQYQSVEFYNTEKRLIDRY